MQQQAQEAQIHHWLQVPLSVPLKTEPEQQKELRSSTLKLSCVCCLYWHHHHHWQRQWHSSLGAEPCITLQGLGFTLPGTYHCWGTSGAEMGFSYHIAPSKCQCGSGLAQVIPQDNDVLSCLLLPGPTPRGCNPHKSQHHTFLPSCNYSVPILFSLCFLPTFCPSFHVSSSVITTDEQSCYPSTRTF